MFEQLDVAGTFQGKFALADWTRTGRLHGAELDTVLEENGRILSSCDSIRYWFRLVLIWKSGGRNHKKSFEVNLPEMRTGQVLEANGCPILLAEKEFARPPALGCPALPYKSSHIQFTSVHIGSHRFTSVHIGSRSE
jgi:hypothetical protein